MAAITLEELLKQVGVHPEKLNESTSDDHLREIALFLPSWRTVASHLDLDENDLDDAEQGGRKVKDKSLKALQIWRGKFGFKATHKKLVGVLLSLGMADVAEKVCLLLKEAIPVHGSITDGDSQFSTREHEETTSGTDTGLTSVLSIQPPFQQLSLSEQEELKGMLCDDVRKMKRLFGSLVTTTCDSVEERIPVMKFAKHILALGAYDPAPEERDRSLLDEHRQEIKGAKTISEIFIILSAYWNYLNYEILEYIIEHYGTSEDNKRLRNYNEKLHDFCKRRIFELPMPERGNGTENKSSSKQEKLHVKLDVREDIPADQFYQIKGRIATILYVRPATLQIYSIDKGCVQLTFLIPKFVAQEIFPLSQEQTSALSEDVSLIRLECGNYIFEHFPSADESSSQQDRSPYQLSNFLTSDYSSHACHPHPSSPLFFLFSHHSRQMYSRETPSHLDQARSYKAEDSDEGSVSGDSYYPPPHLSRQPTCKSCKALQRELLELQEDLKAMRRERERQEQSNERLREDLQMSHQSADLAYAQYLYRENEWLRQELKRWRRSADPDFIRQFEELKIVNDSLEKEVHQLKAFRGHFKAEYNAINLKNEQLRRTNWQLMDENHQLNVRLLENDKSSFQPHSPESEEPEELFTWSSYTRGLGFQRNTQLRHTYHFAKVIRDPPSFPSQGMEMKRASSVRHVLDYNEPVKEDVSSTQSFSAKACKSSDSSDESILDGLGLLTPEENSQVFMVMGEDINRSVLPEGLAEDKALAMIYALQNCSSIQELIKCLVSYRVSTSADKLEELWLDNERLKSTVEHLKSVNTTLTTSFENAKANMEVMYSQVQGFEANNTRLRHALRLCQQACEVFEVLLELVLNDPRHFSSNSSYYPSFEVFSSLESLTQSPEQVSVKHKVRNLLHTLEGNAELKNYCSSIRLPPWSGERQQTKHWAVTLSQNTDTTSGYSSLSGGLDDEVTQSEVEQLKLHVQALLHYKNHLVSTLVPVDGLKGLDMVKKVEIERDCTLAEHSGTIIDLEDAANAEELCKARQEKAELRRQIYLMEQEKRRTELEVSRMLLHKQKCDRLIFELEFQLKEERRKRKKKRKERRGEVTSFPHDVSELSIEYQSALQREKELARRYEDLFSFLHVHVKDSQNTTEDLMRFVKELRRANNALSDVFEKSQKRHQAEKKQMKHKLISYMNRVQSSGAAASQP